ncbi:UNVERIFIED_CONTAM: hypothetical protein FKN15_008978 [Acipenser sinensis]
MGVFEKCVMVLELKPLPIKQKNKLKTEIKENGGIISYVVDKKCTHVIVSHMKDVSSHRLKSIQQFQIPVVSVEYVSKCIEEGRLVDEDAYAPAEHQDVIQNTNCKNPEGEEISPLSEAFPGDDQEETVKNKDSLDKFRIYSGREGSLPHFPSVFEVAKYSIFNKVTADSEAGVVVELQCSVGNPALPFCVSRYWGEWNNSKVMQKWKDLIFAPTSEEAVKAYELFIKDLQDKDFQQQTKLSTELNLLASEKVKKLLLEEALSSSSISQEVAVFVELIWTEALGCFDDVLASPVNSISPNDVSRAEGILLQARKAMDEGVDQNGLRGIMSEFYTILQHKHGMDFNITKKMISTKHDLCQLIRDIVNASEATLWSPTPSSLAKYQALSLTSVRIHQIFRIGRVNEMLDFQSQLGNVQPLFHASSASSFVGILSRGLLLPKVAVEQHGIDRTDIGNLGCGIYFSNALSTVLKYSKPSESDGTRLLVVCDVALGECKHLHKKDFTLASAPAGYSSVLGVRQTADVASEFQDDEYVVYNPSQVQIKYVVQFCVGEDQVKSFQPTVNVTNEETPADLSDPPAVTDADSDEEYTNPLDSVTEGLQDSSGNKIPLKSVHVKGRMIDLLAQIIVFQTYTNHSVVPIEAKYVFPLDETAAVCGFEAFINGKHVVGEVKEKEKARQEYRQAIQEGHGAYLMDQEAPDVFTISVGNLPPSATVLIKITYVTELAIEFGSIVFRLPGSVAPWQQSKALNERTQLLGGCMESPQYEKKRSADGTRFRGQRVFVFALPSQRRGGSAVTDADSDEEYTNPLDSVTEGLQDSSGNKIPLKSVHVKGRMIDLLAQIIVFQTYTNHSVVPIEAKYVFPLDETAAVCGFEAFINGKHVVGEVKEKEKARQEYRQAIQEGHGAYLMDQEAPDVFTISVGNLPPSSTVLIKITYVTELAIEFGSIVFRLPGSVAPWQQSKALNERTQKTQCKAVVITEENSSLGQGGFSLTIDLSEVYLPRMWVEKHPDKDSQACMLVFCPEFAPSSFPEDCEVVIFLDSSNSMRGAVLQEARKIAVRLLNSLHCKLNVVIFGTVDVTLDPDTAHPRLTLSAEGKRVRLGETRQDLPDNPERFGYRRCVLGREGFTSGRRYWQVQVGENRYWRLGVSRESGERKGKFSITPQQGYWAVWGKSGDGDEFTALTDPQTPLPLSLKPWTLGVYLNYEEGQLSFYNVETRSHIYTFTDMEFNPNNRLYPFFWTYSTTDLVLESPDLDPNPNPACMLVFCPEFAPSSFPEDCEVVIFLDSSNSMRGAVLQEARKIAVRLLNSLHCKLNVVIFGTDYKELFPCPQDDVLEAAKQFIMFSPPLMGNTDLWRPLRSLSLLAPSKGVRNIVLISDGHIQSEGLTLRLVKENAHHTRIFTCGVGHTANRHMLRSLAQSGGGAYEFFDMKTKHNWREKIALQVIRMVSPGCSSVSVKWQQFNPNASQPVQAPAQLHSVFSGNQLLVYGFVPHCTQATLSGVVSNQEIQTMVSTTELQKTKGTVRKAALKSFVIDLSKEYSIVTQYTSFVAIEKRGENETEGIDAVTTDERIAEEDVDFLPYLTWERAEDDFGESLDGSGLETHRQQSWRKVLAGQRSGTFPIRSEHWGSVKKAVDWVKVADWRYPSIYWRLELGRDWESTTRQLLCIDPVKQNSPLHLVRTTCFKPGCFPKGGHSLPIS